VFKTTDGGTTWAPASSGITSIDIRALAIDPSAPGTIYAAAAPTLPDGFHRVNGGVFKTTNGGVSWTSASSGLPDTEIVLAFAIDPASPSTIYAGAFSGVFKSSDGGASWLLVNRGTFSYAVTSSLALDPHSPATIYAGQYYNGPYLVHSNYGEVAKSTDAGASWVGVNNGFDHPYRPAIISLAVDPLSTSTVYAGTQGGGVFRTLDGGSSWVAVNGGLDNPAALTVAALAIDPRSPTTLYAGTFYQRGLFKITLAADTCITAPTALCLNSGRFRVEVSWRTPSGASGAGQALPMSSDAGSFWFFSSNNVELVVKVVDGRTFNNKFWVFYGALTNVEYTITVTDTQTGVVKTYFNPQGQLASVADAAAF
jgi:photosystem II stability/assembly factor-like uncharacterized protein